jgi:prevent-host-death family protein
MTSVGIRELRDKLSHYVRQVETTGEPLIITDHGRPVAELVPPAPRAPNAHLQSLYDRGLAIPARRPGAMKDWKGTGIKLPHSVVMEILDEIRDER